MDGGPGVRPADVVEHDEGPAERDDRACLAVPARDPLRQRLDILAVGLERLGHRAGADHVPHLALIGARVGGQRHRLPHARALGRPQLRIRGGGGGDVEWVDHEQVVDPRAAGQLGHAEAARGALGEGHVVEVGGRAEGGEDGERAGDRGLGHLDVVQEVDELGHAHGVAAGGGVLTTLGPVADIETRADCERLVRAFYGRALADPVIGFLFTDVAQIDLEAHVPRITDFWETVLLGGTAYRGGVFGPHLRLHQKAGLRAGHFTRWLALWSETVDGLFAGERAETAKAHAVRTANAFVSRLAAFDEPVTTPGVVVIQRG